MIQTKYRRSDNTNIKKKTQKVKYDKKRKTLCGRPALLRTNDEKDED